MPIQINAIQNRFKDIDNNFTVNPLTGDVVKKLDEQAVKQAVKNIVLLNHYETAFQPFKGGNVIASLFEVVDSAFVSSLRLDLEAQLRIYEPRITVVSVDAEETSENLLEITIEFQITGIEEVQTVEFPIKKVR